MISTPAAARPSGLGVGRWVRADDEPVGGSAEPGLAVARWVPMTVGSRASGGLGVAGVGAGAAGGARAWACGVGGGGRLSAQRRAVSVSSATVCRAASRLSTSMPAVIMFW